MREARAEKSETRAIPKYRAVEILRFAQDDKYPKLQTTRDAAFRRESMNEYQVFSGKIYRVGLIRYVDVPAGVSRTIRDGAVHVPVEGEVEGVPLRSTLVSRGKGAYRLAIHSDIRKKLRVDTGAFVEIALRRDEESREPGLPPVLVMALRQSPKAQTEFRRMTTALRRQVVRYLVSVKQQSTLERRVVKFVRLLEQRGRQRRKGT